MLIVAAVAASTTAEAKSTLEEWEEDAALLKQLRGIGIQGLQ